MKKTRVAVYRRVSRDQKSYASLIGADERRINSESSMLYVGSYIDQDGCRSAFKRLMAAADEGDIDRIETESISAFANNIGELLTTVCKLRCLRHPVVIHFEKENIWTFDSKGELLLTIMSSLAQEESRSISENVIWGHRKRMADGKVMVPFSRFLGYDRGEDGNLVVNREEAKTVKLIYGDFLAGLSCYAIAEKLTAMGVKTPAGKDKWSQGTVKRILQNEKYAGNALLQKSYIADFLTKKQVVNHGEVPQYFVEDNHEAIIEPAVFDRVQDMIKERSKKKGYSGVTIFSSRIRCGCCGGWYGSKVWHSTDKYRRVIWQCNSKFKDHTRCQTPHLTVNAKDDVVFTLTSGMEINA